jgi:hypothetical protein
VSRRFDRLLRWYLWVLMVGLLVQGLGSLLFRLIPALPASTPLLVRGTFGIDFWHSWIHIIWGAAGIWLLLAHPTRHALTGLALVFGIFYTAFGILGVMIHHPLGLELDWFENSFHLTAGPLTLLVGLLSLATAAAKPAGAVIGRGNQ